MCYTLKNTVHFLNKYFCSSVFTEKCCIFSFLIFHCSNSPISLYLCIHLLHTPDDLLHAPDDLLHIPDDLLHAPDDLLHIPDDLLHTPDDRLHTSDNLLHTPDDLTYTI